MCDGVYRRISFGWYKERADSGSDASSRRCRGRACEKIVVTSTRDNVIKKVIKFNSFCITMQKLLNFITFLDYNII